MQLAKRVGLWMCAAVSIAACERHQRDAVPPAVALPVPVVEAPPAPKPLEVTAKVASVSLADDCAADADGAGRKSCMQTSMQLILTAGTGGAASKVEIARVELFDEKTGQPLGDLIPRSPTTWNGKAFTAWDGMLSPTATLNAGWELSSPDWKNISGTRERAGGRSFVVRVTLRVDGQDISADGVVKLKPRKIRVKSPPVIVEPPMVT